MLYVFTIPSQKYITSSYVRFYITWRKSFVNFSFTDRKISIHSANLRYSYTYLVVDFTISHVIEIWIYWSFSVKYNTFTFYKFGTT